MVDRARAGRASAVLLVGRAGIGKSVLLGSLRTATSAATLLVAGGDRRMAQAPGGVAGILALPVRHRLLPKVARHQLDRIWDDAGCPPEEAADAILACASTAGRSPLVYLVDDLDLLDPAGRDAVLALATRATSESVVVVATSGVPLAEWPASTVELAPLTDTVIRALLSHAGVHGRVAEELLPAIGGNPAAMRALLAGLSPEVLAGTDRLPSPLPLDPRLVVERAVELAAQGQDHCVATIQEVLEGTGDLTTLAAVPPRLRRRAHLGVASRSEGVAHLLHRAAGADRADDDLARELVDVAETELAARRLAGATELLIAAGAIAADPALTATCWYRAAVGSYLTGHGRRALDLVGALRAVPGADVPAAALGRIEALAGLHIDGVEAVLRRLSPPTERAIREGDHAAARSLLLIAGAFSLWGCRVAELADLASRCAALPAPDPLAAATTALFAASADLYAAADTAPVRALAPRLAALADVPPSADPLPDLDLDPSRSQFFAALVLLTDEHWEPARRLLEQVSTHDREVGWTGAEGLDAAWYAVLLWRTGSWDEALGLARRTLASIDPGLGRSRLWLHAFLAGAEHVTGDVDAAARHRAAVEADRASPCRIPLVEVIMRAGAGLGHLCDGDAGSAVAELRLLRDLAGPMHPGLIWWRADLVEALAATGDRTEARHAAAELEALAGNAPAPALQGRVLRARALAAGGRRGLRLHTQAVEVHERAGCPFELARSLLAAADCRWGLGGGDEAIKSDAHRARAIFEHLGARGMAARAAALGAGASASSLLTGLSERERQIAELVAAGATNKQVATHLGVSVRTVGSHLEAVYRKLRITTRAQLASIVRSG